MKDVQYIPERKGHWSFDEELGKADRDRLARMARVRRRVDEALGTALWMATHGGERPQLAAPKGRRTVVKVAIEVTEEDIF